MEPPVRQRSQRPPHLRLHRGPAAGHLQPGRGQDESGGGTLFMFFQYHNCSSERMYYLGRRASLVNNDKMFLVRSVKEKKILEKALILSKWI